jgi:hypothetical protein
MKRSLWLVLAAATAASIAMRSYGCAAGAHAHPGPLSVDAALDVRSLQQGGSCFLVDTVITNRGSADEEIVVWTNYAWSWVSDSPDITFNTGAKRNAPSRVVLKPNEKYSATLQTCRRRSPGKPIRFRLGFVPRAELPASGQNDVTKWGGTFWSGVLTLI